jgi:hypothetical protein
VTRDVLWDPREFKRKIPNLTLRQGWFVALPILFSFIGMVMVAVGGFSCKMVKGTEAGVDGYFYFGFTSAERDGTCVNYQSYDPDPPLETGNAFAILATVFGVLTLVAAILTTFVRFPPLAVLGMSVSAFVVAGFATIVTGVGFANETCKATGYTCTPGSMMYVTLVGTLFWIAAGATFLFVNKFERDAIMEGNGSTPIPGVAAALHEGGGMDESQTPTTVIETITNPDGTKTRTITVTSYKDGQTIVEKTIDTV